VGDYVARLVGRDELVFDRSEWAALRANTPLDLGPDDVAALQGINERLDMAEVADVYLPLSRLLSLHAIASADRDVVADTFLGVLPAHRPYVIGLAGSVAVGKSTTSRILQELLARWPAHPSVELVTTDGFLYPNRVLTERGLMERKGFAES
jgi:type I pantothenate kinase